MDILQVNPGLPAPTQFSSCTCSSIEPLWTSGTGISPARCPSWLTELRFYSPPAPQLFYGSFAGPPALAGARRELLDSTVQGKINRGRHIDHPARRHSIRTKQCPPPPSLHTSHSTQYRSYRRCSSQPISWLALRKQHQTHKKQPQKYTLNLG